MKLYQCKLCKKVCADGREEDPGNYEMIDEHMVMEHPDELISFFDVYSLKSRVG